ncbi:TetR family transcriptional regulator [Companilactobacillus tucceti DSM 20183]|uniref:TetR family transcriptional regulator n=1 Tax=Companilactobacillus tucceti DSM 20183 TaxID=1423811 RepID=A0A0R1IYF8_9LACO|nr:TetR/AcrR family transcriptional regulator [Companilactobacillus tucceti]KRK63992.1 TetR family transcriptional regulator [Companilactobacillus tucceti DSM 20183]
MNTTKASLANALMSILKTKPFNKITVKNVVDECGLTRQTFYNHFGDMYELVEWTCLQAIKESLHDNCDYDHWQKGLYKLMLAIKENSLLVNNMQRSENRDILVKYIYKIINNYVITVVEKQSYGLNVSQEDKSFVAHFYSLAFIATIVEWIKDDMKADPEEISKNIGILLKGNFRSDLEKYVKS